MLPGHPLADLKRWAGAALLLLSPSPGPGLAGPARCEAPRPAPPLRTPPATAGPHPPPPPPRLPPPGPRGPAPRPSRPRSPATALHPGGRPRSPGLLRGGCASPLAPGEGGAGRPLRGQGMAAVWLTAFATAPGLRSGRAAGPGWTDVCVRGPACGGDGGCGWLS